MTRDELVALCKAEFDIEGLGDYLMDGDLNPGRFGFCYEKEIADGMLTIEGHAVLATAYKVHTYYDIPPEYELVHFNFYLDDDLRVIYSTEDSQEIDLTQDIIIDEDELYNYIYETAKD